MTFTIIEYNINSQFYIFNFNTHKQVNLDAKNVRATDYNDCVNMSLFGFCTLPSLLSVSTLWNNKLANSNKYEGKRIENYFKSPVKQS